MKDQKFSTQELLFYNVKTQETMDLGEFLVDIGIDGFIDLFGLEEDPDIRSLLETYMDLEAHSQRIDISMLRNTLSLKAHYRTMDQDEFSSLLSTVQDEDLRNDMIQLWQEVQDEKDEMIIHDEWENLHIN